MIQKQFRSNVNGYFLLHEDAPVVPTETLQSPEYVTLDAPET